MENPLFNAPPSVDKPYRRVIELVLTDKHSGKVVKITHETDIEPDYLQLKKDLQGKVSILLEAVYN